MSLTDRYDLDKLMNWNAVAIYEKIEEVLDDRRDICHCEECVLDLVAYTLNRVPPLYGTSMLEPLHPDKEKERKLEEKIEKIINSGLKKIAQHPHHLEKLKE